MSKFNIYLWGFICFLPLGLILLIIGVYIRSPEPSYSAISLIIFGISVLTVASFLLNGELIKYGKQTV